MRLYHYTEPRDAWCILSDKELLKDQSGGSITPFGDGAGFCVTQPRPGISLTANPRLMRTLNAGGDGRPWASARIEIDGAVLAARGVKLEAYVDEMHGIGEADDQQEMLVRADRLDLTGAIVGVEVNLEECLHNDAARSIEQVYVEETGWENMPMAQKRAKYDPDETLRVREFEAWAKNEGIPVREVTEFSLPESPSLSEGKALLTGAALLRPPSLEVRQGTVPQPAALDV